MSRCVGVKTDHAGAGISEHTDQRINGLNHQMNIDGSGDTKITQGFAHHRPNRQVGHVVVVHHIEMHPIGTRR